MLRRMNQQPPLTDTNSARIPFRVPAVRHLAWMCRVPQLISSPIKFDPGNYLPADAVARLRAWDAEPDHGPAILTELPAKRLGLYFERLYACLMEDVLGWEILLQNQPILGEGRTLGELDFIVRNPADGLIEHHEIAVKFYLGYRRANRDGPLWYGPNARDRLDLKSGKMTDRQSQLTERPETRDLLASLGINAPIRPRLFMPGYLFYPWGTQLSSPTGPAANHLRGSWLFIDELEQPGLAARHNTRHWVPLVKPHWLGPWHQDHVPARQPTEDALEMVRSKGIPRLFAIMEPDEAVGIWREASRVFVMPGAWPGKSNHG